MISLPGQQKKKLHIIIIPTKSRAIFISTQMVRMNKKAIEKKKNKVECDF